MLSLFLKGVKKWCRTSASVWNIYLSCYRIDWFVLDVIILPFGDYAWTLTLTPFCSVTMFSFILSTAEKLILLWRELTWSSLFLPAASQNVNILFWHVRSNNIKFPLALGCDIPHSLQPRIFLFLWPHHRAFFWVLFSHLISTSAAHTDSSSSPMLM